jgi:hypothetical protein
LASGLILDGGIARPVEEKLIHQDDGLVYKQEWWTSWLIERPLKTQGLRADPLDSPPFFGGQRIPAVALRASRSGHEE